MAAIVIPVTLINPRMIGGENLTAIAMDAALLMIVAVGQMLVMLTRNIDLSVASVIGLSAYGAAGFMHNHPASPVLMGVGVASLIGLGCGLLNGLVVTLGGVPSIVVTLGSLAVFRGLVSLWAGGRQISADQVPQAWLDMTGARVVDVPAVVLIALAALVAIGTILYRFASGREIYAIGSNPDGAALIGIRTTLLVLCVFAAAGLLAGFDGALWASRYATIDARVAMGFELTVIASVVVGGVAIRGGAGSVLGVALGALTLLVIQNGLTLVRVDPLWLQGVYGVVILAAVAIDTVVGRRTRRDGAHERRSRRAPRELGRLSCRPDGGHTDYAVTTVPNFATAFNISQAIAGVSERALIVLPMVLLIIAREIDLSVASMLALSSVVFGVAIQAGAGISLAILAALLTGLVGGALNGALVTLLGLPSLVVTLGTLALFRGIGYIILGSGSVNEFPDAFTDFGIDTVGGSILPWTIVPFLILAPIFAVLLQKGAIGRRIYAIGGNPDVARYAGVRVGRIRLALFATSGMISALAGVVFTARLANARADNAVGLELDVITIALLGGISVFGGRGHLTGVFFALVLIAALRNILGLLQIGGDAQGTVIGLLLIGSLLLSTVTQRLFASASAFLASPDSGGSKPGDPPEARSSPTIGA